MRSLSCLCFVTAVLARYAGAVVQPPASGTILSSGRMQGQQAVGSASTTAWVNSNSLGIVLNGPKSWFGGVYPQFAAWNQFDGVQWTITNVGSTSADFVFRLDSATGVSTASSPISSEAIVPAGQSRTYYFMFNPSDHPAGLMAWPPASPTAAQYLPPSNSGFSPNSVWRWMLWNNDGSTQQLVLSGFQLIKKRATPNGMFDQYGQSADLKWAGKVLFDSDMVVAGKQEAASLASTKASPDFLSATGTGAWTVKKSAAGNWFLYTPAGRPFWSVGVNEASNDISTQISGRSNLFASLPANSGTSAQFYFQATNTSGQTITAFNLLKSNLYKKFGASYLPAFYAETLSRLPKWGVNTIGGWGNAAVLGKGMPYTVSLSTNAYPTRLPIPTYGWGNLPDVYAPDFATWCTSNFKAALAAHKGDPNFMGAFSDNEMSWGVRSSALGSIEIATTALDAPSSQPARQAFIKSLTAKYGTVSRLNSAWKSRFFSFSQVASAAKGKFTGSAAYTADATNFVKAFAATYFSKVRTALRAAAPNSLYLGCRFAMNWTPDAVIAAGAGNTDVLSVNAYDSLNQDMQILSQYNRPVLISEFGYMSSERGGTSAAAAIQTTTEAQRANQIANYLVACATNKNIVGAHMFGYIDNPASGRWSDGEAWTTGFVDVTDTPYSDIVGVFKNFGAELSALRK